MGVIPLTLQKSIALTLLADTITVAFSSVVTNRESQGLDCYLVCSDCDYSMVHGFGRAQKPLLIALEERQIFL